MDNQGLAPPSYEEVTSSPAAAASPTAGVQFTSPEAGQDFKGAPQGGAYAPQYQGVAYATQGGGYAPQGGTYAPQPGAYAPQGSTYAPQPGTYAPQGGAYAPQGVYSVQVGGYTQSGSTAVGFNTQQIIQPACSGPPPDYMTFAVLVTIFFFLPLGIVGIMKAMEAKNRWQCGDTVGAHRSAQEARRYSMLGLFIGIPVIIMMIILIVVFYI